MTARRGVDEPPEAFRRALADLRAARLRPEVALDEAHAPQRLAPYSVALTADVLVAEEELATGRLVLLHDPAGQEPWHGTFRLVTFVRAALEAELAMDPLLAQVGWAWLTEALAAHGAHYVEPSGTVTRVTSESFGRMAGRAAGVEIEVRASWTPVSDGPEPSASPGVAAHVEAWGDLLCTVAGLPPLPTGVVTLPARPARAGRRTR